MQQQTITLLLLIALLLCAIAYLIYVTFIQKRERHYEFFRGQRFPQAMPVSHISPSLLIKKKDSTLLQEHTHPSLPPSTHIHNAEDEDETEAELDENKEPHFTITAEMVNQFKLLEESDLSEEILKDLTNMTDQITRPQGIFSNLLIGQLGPKELADLVSSDPEIASKILRIVNSAAYGLTKKITSVQRASIFLGTALVRDIAMRLCMQSVLKKGNLQLERAYHLFWQSSVIASHLCQRLAPTFYIAEPATLATRTLLSFIGNLVILSNRPEIAPEYQQKSSLFERTWFEQDLLHSNAAIMGSMLCRKWRLPDVIEIGIQHSLYPMRPLHDTANIPVPELAEIVLSYVCCRIGEQVIFNKLTDIAECSLAPERGPEYWYIHEYLEKSKLERLPQALQQMKLRQDINHLIEQLRGQRMFVH